jgi:hypothetical protein
MAYEQITIREIVERAVEHNGVFRSFNVALSGRQLSLVILQNRFGYDYPIGSLLVWSSNGHTEEQHAQDAKQPSLWVVDGQQRSTALCILCGRKPYWWRSRLSEGKFRIDRNWGVIAHSL